MMRPDPLHGADAPDAELEPGVLDARYLGFLATVTDLRPSLHRDCARMTGSVADGEDLVQEALFHAYRRLDAFDDARPLKPWLFRIAHNRCVDFLRRRGVREDAEAGTELSDVVLPIDPPGPALRRAVEHLVLTLPRKECACVLLKDVLDDSLEEIAVLVDSTVGGVKAALHRGRAKLAAAELPRASPRHSMEPEVAALLGSYVECFNRRDWDGLRQLVTAGRYARLTAPWRVVTAEVDGEPMIISEYERNGVWEARGSSA